MSDLLLLVTSVCWLVLPLLAAFDRRDTNRVLWPWLEAGGALALLAFACCGPREMVAPHPFALGLVPIAFHLDALAAWFLAIIALITLAVAPSLHGYMESFRERIDMRGFWICASLLPASMASVVLAANAQTFLVAWEIMSLSSFVLVVSDHASRSTRTAGAVYLGATRVGTGCVAGAFIWLYELTGKWSFDSWHVAGTAAVGPALLLLIGLGVKAGMWPFHLWLPLAHPAAPSPVSATMSGLMVKVALYAMIRFFLWPGHVVTPVIGHLLLALGAISAFWGVLFALLQHDLKRLLAYSTVENVGLIIMGIGLAVICRTQPSPHSSLLSAVGAVALGAALLHVWNHAFFKSLLFIGAGSVDHGAGTRDLDRLGGLARPMPVTFACFLLGSAAICALPPLNGFASEWLLYQSFFRFGCLSSTPLFRFLALGTIGWIALVGALALSCFVKVTGITFLGQPRSSAVGAAHESPRGMLVSQGVLALGCVVLGVGAPFVLELLRPLTGPSLRAAFTLPIPTLVFTLLLGLAVGALALLRPVRSYVTWECGFGPLNARMQTTAASFAQPVARLFGSLYRYVVDTRVEGRHRRHFPEAVTVQPAVRSILASRLYLPVLASIDRLARRLVRLQGGSIHVYLLTMFLTLWILVLIGRFF